MTFTDKKVLIYRNGALAKSLNRNGATPASSNGALVIGGNGAGAFTGAYAGRVDEVAVFPQVLSASDIKQHFTAAHVPINTAPPVDRRHGHGRLDADRAARHVDRRRDGDLHVGALRRGRRGLRGHHGRDRHDVRRRRRGRVRHAPGRRDDDEPPRERARRCPIPRARCRATATRGPGPAVTARAVTAARRDRRDRRNGRHRDGHGHRDGHRHRAAHRHEDRHEAGAHAGRSGRGADLPARRLVPQSHADPPRRRRPRRTPGGRVPHDPAPRVGPRPQGRQAPLGPLPPRRQAPRAGEEAALPRPPRAGRARRRHAQARRQGASARREAPPRGDPPPGRGRLSRPRIRVTPCARRSAGG